MLSAFGGLNLFLYLKDNKMSDQTERKVEFKGIKRWLLNDKIHRENGPAVEWPDGEAHWYLNGKLHREGGPAIERPCGSKSWFFNGELHRVDGPAVEAPNGERHWYLNDKRHRIGGPAIEMEGGERFWFINNREFSHEDYIAELEKLGMQIVAIDCLFDLK
jgi:hypothetical protein